MWSSFLYWGGGCSLDESSSSKCTPTISPASPLPSDSISVWNSHLFLWSSHLLHNVCVCVWGGGGCPSYKCRLLTADLLTIAPCFPPHKMAVSLSLSFTSLVLLCFCGGGGQSRQNVPTTFTIIGNCPLSPSPTAPNKNKNHLSVSKM